MNGKEMMIVILIIVYIFLVVVSQNEKNRNETNRSGQTKKRKCQIRERYVDGQENVETIKCKPIEDSIKPYNPRFSISGMKMNSFNEEQKNYKPSLYSIHIFPFLENQIIFIKNGVKYARCQGESILISEVDQKI